jgi:AcrR family transcriptional regulator
LSRPPQVVFEPRKSPVQARSTISVHAILEATLQVLLDVGKERLTTTRVAQRAGVSVGTLYQYFPNKSALLQAALKEHLESVARALEEVCLEERASPLPQLATRFVDVFLEAKMKNLKASAALYSVASDVDGARIAGEIGTRINKAIVSALSAAHEPLRKDPQLVASLIQSAMVGVSRRLLESPCPEEQYQPLKQELSLMIRAYLAACAVNGAN